MNSGVAILRQWTNLATAAAMPVTALLAFTRGVSFDDAVASPVGAPLIEPAGYAFGVWSVIYAGGIAYAVVQARLAERFNPLFMRIGWWTASAFASVSAWLVAARLGLIWGTVACILWMAASLLPVFRAVSIPDPHPRGHRWSVTTPFGIFFGWVSLAVFANTAAALKVDGLIGPANEPAVTVAMLAAAGVLGAIIAAASGSWAYVLTVQWGLIAIAVANILARGPYPAIVAAALAAAGFVGGGQWYGRRRLQER